ncbi:hypothetical protein JAAARDRAFT_52267 [Jaapia argillacea MUCL 33604]|uniref:Uncharacterized protein n=1 Tax=Jaapia argillacea MUCL 33604 TaxID=933084 RepID=A0A067QDR0_9AGAM|nr:hypothetical protein JAAARDRAFT_52267 [Jaapia argillacea MUCL 33604]
MPPQGDPVYACKCLNIQVHAQSASGSPPESQDQDFFPVYVGENGLAIAHNQVTLRTRGRVQRDDEQARWTRLVSLTCLICQSMVYRVLQTASPDVDGREGPVIPTEDWAEAEPLKPVNGWIEVHKGCMTGDAIEKMKSSPNYSQVFDVVLPIDAPTSSSAPSYLPPVPSPPPEQNEESKTHLPALPPLFPPPPFVPSHPTFAHLAAQAASKSEALRAEAEEFLAQATRDKVAEIDQAEQEIRRQVEVLWRKFRESLVTTEPVESRGRRRSTSRRRDSDNWSRPAIKLKPDEQGAIPVSVKDFVPLAQTTPSRGRSTSPNRRVQSGISVSMMGTSTLHQAKAKPVERAKASSSGIAPDPIASSPPLVSGRTIPGRDIGGSILEPFRRNMNENLDIATSFKYVTNLEAEMVQTRGGDEKLERKRSRSPSKEPISADGVVPPEGSEEPDGTTKKARSTSRTRQNDVTIPEGPKVRRKVTFDVEPAVVTITREVKAEKEAKVEVDPARNVDQMIFDLDEEGNGRQSSEADDATAATLPLNESLRSPVRPRARSRKSDTRGLPASLSTLRPASLPAPSAVRPRSLPDTDTQDIEIIEPRSLQSNGDKSDSVRPRQTAKPVEPERNWDPREQEILKLVAADIPSHRGAWKRDSKAWSTFVRRQGGRATYPTGGMITEEDEDEDTQVNLDDDEETDEEDEESDFDDRKIGDWTTMKTSALAASLPIAIGPLSTARKQHGIPSYQPKTSLSDRPGILVPRLPLSGRSREGSHNSEAYRKAAYAERDRHRERDPGALDFSAEDVEDETPESGEETPLEAVGGRGRQHALRILQKRNEVPDAGMWRSLVD